MMGHDSSGDLPICSRPAGVLILRGDVMSSLIGWRATLSRRGFIKKSALAAGALALPMRAARAAGSLKPVTMTLDWLFQGPNVGFMLAQDKGFYREAGLDVAITPGKGSGSAAQLIASGAAQFGFADGYVVG